MQQLALDIRTPPVPRLDSLITGPNEAALAHVRHCVDTLTSPTPLPPQPPQLPPPAPDSPRPVYLWGPAGSGKTHFLCASAHALHQAGVPFGWLEPASGDRAALPPLIHPYIQQLAAEQAEATDTPHTPTPSDGAGDADGPACPAFQPHWRAIILHDVDAYSPAEQQVAFNWFVNALHPPQGGAPLWVLAAGAAPVADLPLREDVRTRLGWGHVFGLQPLDDAATRLALHQAAQARGLALADDVIAYMQHHFSRDPGSLLTLLDMLDYYSLQHQRPVTIPLLKQMLRDS